ncbi:MAG: amidohydrolase family protein, partial [Acetobacteraceae bacterium]
MPGPVTSVHLPVREGWLERRREDIIEPDLSIVDPHHHLVDRPETGRYLLPELLRDTGSGHNITATVYLEWLSMYRSGGPAGLRPVGEVEFANGIAAMAASGTYGDTQVCAGIVGHADLSLGAAVEPVLETMIAAGGGRFRGIRTITATHPHQAAWGSPVLRPEHMLMDRKVREGFARLAPLGLSFDAWLYHAQLPELIDLARTFPETPIVLDHVGGPIGLGPYAGRRDEVFTEWRARIGELAACPNVHVKLGGLGMRMFGFAFHERDLPPSSEELAAAWRPCVETCLAAFGARRAMFESNFPVDKGSCGYAVLWNAFKRIAAGCSAAEKGAWVSVPFMVRYSFWAVTVKRMIAEGAFGRISHIVYRGIRPTMRRYVEWDSPWMADKSQAGGGALLNLGGHGFDIARFVTGEEPEVVSAVVSRQVH